MLHYFGFFYALVVMLSASDNVIASHAYTNGENASTDDFGRVRQLEEINQTLQDLAMDHPQFTTIFSIGSSIEGRDIKAISIEDKRQGSKKFSFLICAAHHANEVATPEYALDAVEWLLTNKSNARTKRWLDQFRIVVVPVVNPDGLFHYWNTSERYGRKNRRVFPESSVDDPDSYGVDLNRNYPFGWGNVNDSKNSSDPRSVFYRGPYPGSEPETRAMMEMAERERFVGVISFHSTGSKILVPYTTPDTEKTKPSTAWLLGKQMLKALPHKFYRRRPYQIAKNLYDVGGTDQDWYHYKFNSMSYIVETPMRIPSDKITLEEAVSNTRPVWQFMLDRFLDGPSVNVTVVDIDGNPLRAGISFKEIVTKNAEYWMTDPESGSFATYLPSKGAFKMRIKYKGKNKDVKIKVGGLEKVLVTFDE